MRWLCLWAALTACERPKGDEPFTLRLALPSKLGPITSGSGEGSASSIAGDWIFESLASFDERGAVVPRLARTVEFVGPYKARVRLRPATFSDGTPLSEADVIRSLAKRRLRAVVVSDAVEVEAEDRTTPFDIQLVNATIVRSGPDGEIGTGPFVVASEGADTLVLNRRVPRGNAINSVVLRGFASQRDAFIRTLRGDADLLRIPEPRDLEFFEGVPRLRVVRGKSSSVHAVAFNVRRLDRAERSALVRTLQPGPISAGAYGDGCDPIASPAAFQPLPPGRRLEILVPRGYEEKLGLAVRRALGERGGEVRALDFQHYFEALKAGDFDLVAGHPRKWPPSAGAANWRTGSPGNFLRYSNPLVDAALDSADWAAADRELLADPPAAFLCTLKSLAVVDARVQDARLGPWSLFETLPEWRVSP